MARRLAAVAALVAAGPVGASEPLVGEQLAAAELQLLLDFASLEPERFVKEVIHPSPLKAIAPTFVGEVEARGDGTALPTVTAHGMGDTCFNPGMKSITHQIGVRTGSYAQCIPTGGNEFTDVIHGFLMSMDKNVDVFAEKVRADPKLAGGFNAVGFSQGNSIIRGYIQRYNDPPVHAFLSVHGTVEGVAGFPSCNPGGKILGRLCQLVSGLLADFAYMPLFQHILFQANYFRDPKRISSKAYRKHSQLAAWNNEGFVANATFKTNFVKTQKFAMVKALKDSMVYPNEAEHWGQFQDQTFTVTPMKDMPYYENDSFGLKTVDGQQRVFYEETAGDHLEFTREELMGWVDKYFLSKEALVVV